MVTLGTLYAFRGLAFLWTNGRQVNAETLPDSFLNLGSDSIAGVPILVIIALVIVLVVGQWLRDYRAGRELYAIGSNPEGARLAGVRSQRRVLAAFVLSGALAGLGGVLFTARFGTVDATAGVGYELTVIAAAVVGGVAIFGGIGTVYGAALGALLLTTITSSLIVLRVAAFWQQAAIGALLLVRHRARPAPRGARRGGSAPQERAPCRLSAVTSPDAPPAGRRDARARLAPRARPLGDAARRPARWPPRRRAGDLARVPDDRLLHHRLARLLRGRADGAAARDGHRRRRDRPVGRLGPRASRAR